MKAGYACLVFALLASHPAFAEDATVATRTNSPYFVDGEKLLGMCSSPPGSGNGVDMCDAYIGGVIDTIVANRDVIQGYHICWPNPAVGLDVYVGVVTAYLRDHPEFKAGVASSLVDTALFDAYRCLGALPPPG
jgi:hypothetical protein